MGRLPENVYEEYKARRRGVIRALTSDVSHRARQGGRYLFTPNLICNHLIDTCHTGREQESVLHLPAAAAPPPCLHTVPLTVCRLIYAQVDKFFSQCDPERENLCLYGLPDGTWAVDLPAEEVPPEIPEPALGINFARDGMQVRCAVELGQHLLV